MKKWLAIITILCICTPGRFLAQSANGNYFISDSLWEGAHWDHNIPVGVWMPTIDTVANFAIDNYSWGEVRTKDTIIAGSPLMIHARMFLDTPSPVNGEAAYFGFGDQWESYGDGHSCGVAFTAGKICFYEKGAFMDSIGTYETGGDYIFSIWYDGAGIFHVTGSGFAGTYTPNLVVAAKRCLITSENSNGDHGFQVLSIDYSSGIVAYFPFNGNANDESGNGNNGLVAGATPTEDRFGHSNKAFSFSNNGDSIVVLDSPILNSDYFTLAGWVYYQGGAYNAHPLNKGGQFDFFIETTGGDQLDAHINGDRVIQNTGIAVPHDLWSFVTLVKSADSVCIYLDGQLRAATALSGVVQPTPSDFTIGSRAGDPGTAFHGKIDDVRLYNRPLSSGEVDALYHEGGWPNVNPDILLSAANSKVMVGDTVLIPLHAQFPSGKSYSAAEITLGGYKSGLTFLGVDTAGSLIGPAGWMVQVHETDSLLVLATAGAYDISGEGNLLDLKFVVTGSPCTTTSLELLKAVFNTGTDSVALTSGSVDIKARPVYGDVDENGSVQAYDASLILKRLADIYPPFTCQGNANADVNADDSLTAWDASVILRYDTGDIDHLPYATTIPASGSFVKQDVGGHAGDIIEVPIVLSGVSNLYSVEGSFRFDPSILHFLGVRADGIGAGLTIASKVDGNNISIVGASGTPIQSGGSIALLTFRIEKSQPTDIVAQRVRFNTNAPLGDVKVINLGVGDSNGNNPKEYSLNQNYPNPFNPVTNISYGLPERTHVKLEVFTTLGLKIGTLVEGNQEAGFHQVSFDGSNLASGIYYYRISAGNFVSTKKLMLVK